MLEKWKDIPEFNGAYQASDLGRIRSIDRTVKNRWGGWMVRKGVVLKDSPAPNGYRTVTLYVDGKPYYRSVHSLVATTWVANPENKPEVNHKDGVKKNCTASNLEWATRSENAQHASDNGLMCGIKGIESLTKEKAMEPSVFASAINDTAELCHRISKEHGFWDVINVSNEDGSVKGQMIQFNFGEKIALIHSELSEALEKHRKGIAKTGQDAPDEHCPAFGGIDIELADAVIRIFDLAASMGINIGRAIEAKCKFNESRPMKHNKAY